MEIEEKVLKLVKSRKKGILQNELWKRAEIDRRECSRIVVKLEKEGKITRESESFNGSRTNRIMYVEEKKEKTKNFTLLLTGERFNPCTGCMLECDPEQCMALSEWVCCLSN